LPQLVWLDLPKNFTDIAMKLNCTGTPPELGSGDSQWAHRHRRRHEGTSNREGAWRGRGGEEDSCVASAAAVTLAFERVVVLANELVNDLAATNTTMTHGSESVLTAVSGMYSTSRLALVYLLHFR
jgi:hypothetical protein